MANFTAFNESTSSHCYHGVSVFSYCSQKVELMISNKIRNYAPVALATVFASMVTNSAMAHTRFEVSSVEEGDRVYSNVVIGHGCGHLPVVGSSIVVPDGQDSTILVNDVAYDG